MRRILISSVLLAPVLVSATAFASRPVTDQPASTTNRAISTGVTPAHVIYSAAIDLSPAAASTIPSDAAVVLSLNVDEKGLPNNVQVVSSPTHYLDGAVAASVQKYRFSPATLDNRPVATPMTLTVIVQR